jgi:hypothetical protein
MTKQTEALKLAAQAVLDQWNSPAWTWHKRGPTNDLMADLQEALAQPVQPDIALLVEGMEVSIDVSTGEHDSENRLFGTVTLAQENQGSKHGLILLVQDPEPNFKPAPLPVQEPVAWGVFEGNLHDMFFTQEDAQEMADLKGTHAEVRPLYTTPPLPVQPEREWVGLTDDEVYKITFALEGEHWRKIADAIEAKLKEKNNG